MEFSALDKEIGYKSYPRKTINRDKIKGYKYKAL